MGDSPFQNKQAEKIVMDFIQDDLFPAIEKIKTLNEKILRNKINFFTTYFNKELNSLVREFQDLNEEFFKVYKRFSTPDELFKEISDKGSQPEIIADYFNFEKVVNQKFSEGFHLLEIGDKNLDRKLNVIHQNVSRLIALLAIVISIITALVTLKT